MGVDHAQYIPWDLELDRSLIFSLAAFQNQVGSAIAGTVQVAFQVDVSQVLHANRADQKDGDGERIFARQSPAIRLGGAAWSRENPFRQEQKAQLVSLLLQHA